MLYPPRLDSIVVNGHSLQPTLRYTSFECQLVEFHVDNSNEGSTVAIIYRPPSSSLPTFYDEQSDLLDEVADVIDSDRFIACGDINCAGADSSSVNGELSSLMDAHGLRQLVNTVTRRTSLISNLLVVIASDESRRILQVTVLPTHSVSDHDLVTWLWTSSVRLPRRVLSYRFRNLKSVDWTLFKEDVGMLVVFHISYTYC